MSIDDRFKSRLLPDDVREQLLDDLDARDAAYLRSNRRGGNRFIYRKSGVRIHVEHPGGGGTDTEVATRNLSQTGLSFLYPNFLHTGAQVLIWLKRRLGGVEEVHGTVVWCRHIVGRHHLVGVRFKHEIFTQLFVDPEYYSAEETAEAVDLNTLHGTILHVEDQPTDQSLFKFYLRNASGLKIVSVAQTEQAVELIERHESIDLICSDLNLEMGSGEDAIPLYRTAGFTGPVVCITAETNPRRLSSASAMGAVAIIRKPYEDRRLHAVVAEFLGSVSSKVGQAIVSERSDIPGMETLIESFVECAHAQAAQLRLLAKTENMDAVRAIVMMLIGTGSSVGFPMVTEAGRDVIKSMTSTLSVSLSASEIERLVVICSRLSAGTRVAA